MNWFMGSLALYDARQNLVQTWPDVSTKEAQRIIDAAPDFAGASWIYTPVAASMGRS